GRISFGKTKINGLSTDKIARLGILMAFQSPQSVPGVSAAHLIKLASRDAESQTAVRLASINKKLAEATQALNLPKKFLGRSLNEEFSGGEKKKTEILQLSLLAPKLAILDEVDSGLDVDALKLVGKQIGKLQKRGVGVLIITHYPRILKYVKSDFVHILQNGQIVRSGTDKLADEIEREGYDKKKSIHDFRNKSIFHGREK
ncbi:MAG: ATP-binding cassette domain-containing protein, partial [Patescibacteria group bacterium]|nr:ATP-binding cassette domain-containing protein [Patescibacteria group bacterium]